MKKSTKITLLSVGGVLIGAFLYFSPFNTSRWQRLNDLSHKTTYTLNYMRMLAFAICMSVEEKEYGPLKHPVMMENLFRVPEDDFLSNIGVPYDAQEKVFHDAWDRPIGVSFRPPAVYTFVSFGPNGVDDGGREDDIVTTYDLSGGDLKQVE